MLVYFFSDRNYVRSGFYAHYTITPCRQNCSGHGECLVAIHECRCFPGYVGPSCELPLCAAACAQHGGHCSEDHHFTCVCPPGRVGYDCGLSVNHSDVPGNTAGVWSQLTRADSVYPPRAGHSSAVINDCLYVFGGSTLNTVLNDLVVYCIGGSWSTVDRSDPWPTARYGHAMCAVDTRIYLYGGVLSNGTASNELWVYDISVGGWVMLTTSNSSVVEPPALSGHSLTAVDDRSLYIIGGRTTNGEFVSDIHIAGMLYLRSYPDSVFS